MIELSDEEKAKIKEVLEAVIDYWYNKLVIKMNAGMSYENAVAELKKEMLDGG